MDNITHSLTGALAAKLLERQSDSSPEGLSYQQTLFWLMVVCVNLPDVDVLLNILGDPLFVVKHHRGLTHSILFAPVFAMLPAWLTAAFGTVKRFKTLWLISLFGLLLHISLDVATPFGTQLLAPLSTVRFSLDWMFIINPFFSGILAGVLLLQKLVRKRMRLILVTGAIISIGYLGMEMTSHYVAFSKISEAARHRGWMPTRVSALPQPLSIFRWMGLVQTREAVQQSFFGVSDPVDSLSFRAYIQASDSYVDQALHTDQARWFLLFARHPWIQSIPQQDKHTVEIQDQQFSLNEELMKSLGIRARTPPFVLRFVFSSGGQLVTTTFGR